MLLIKINIFFNRLLDKYYIKIDIFILFLIKFDLINAMKMCKLLKIFYLLSHYYVFQKKLIGKRYLFHSKITIKSLNFFFLKN